MKKKFITYSYLLAGESLDNVVTYSFPTLDVARVTRKDDNKADQGPFIRITIEKM